MSQREIVIGRKDQYEKGEELGKGASGIVYLVRRISDGSFFAMKEQLLPNQLSDDKDKNEEQLPKELKIMRQLSKDNHRNLVSLIEEIKMPEIRKLLIIMEYFKLGDLLHYLQTQEMVQKFSNQATKVEYILRFSLDITCGVIQMHKNNIAHRDLKPENIMVAFDFEQNSPFLKLIDFGTCNENDLMKSKIGTYNYMAPEILNGLNYRNSVDIWSIGCIIHEMITGRQLFGSNQKEQVIIQILSFKKYTDNNFLSSIVKKCLAVNPKDRISDEQLQKELNDMLNNWLELLKSNKTTSQWQQNQQQVNRNQQKPKNQQKFTGWEVFGDSEKQSLPKKTFKHLQQQQHFSQNMEDHVSILHSSWNQSIIDDSFCQLDASKVIINNIPDTQNMEISEIYELINRSSILQTSEDEILNLLKNLNVTAFPEITFNQRARRNGRSFIDSRFYFQENSQGMFEKIEKIQFYEGYFRLLVWICFCQIEKKEQNGRFNLLMLAKVSLQRFEQRHKYLSTKQVLALSEICLILCALSRCEDASVGVIYYFHKLADIAETNKIGLSEELEEIGRQVFQKRAGIGGLVLDETLTLKDGKQITFETLMVNLQEQRICFNQQQMIVIHQILLKAYEISQFEKDIGCAV